MFEVKRNDRPPHVVVRIAGTVAEEDLHEVVRRRAEGASLPAGAVIVIEYEEESAYRPPAGGVVILLLEDLLASDPRILAIVSPASLDTSVRHARKLRERASGDERVRFFHTRAEADAFIARLEGEGIADEGASDGK